MAGYKVCIVTVLAVVLAATVWVGGVARGELQEDKSLPIPLHGLEGVGGVLVTHSAYLVNPAQKEDIFGLPSVGFAYANLGHGRHLTAFTVTETIGDRLELGYGWDRLTLGDLNRQLGARTSTYVSLHNLNARFALIKDGDFGITLMPQITAGVHFKYNQDIDSINDDLAGALRVRNIKDDKGMEFTLYASKLFAQLGRPVLLNVGGRVTDAAQIGLLGFTRDYRVVPEASAVVLVTDKLGVAGEYRVKRSHYASVGKVIRQEDDWWTLCAFYVINNHLTVTAVYGHFGQVLNHRANAVWALRLKYEI